MFSQHLHPLSVPKRIATSTKLVIIAVKLVLGRRWSALLAAAMGGIVKAAHPVNSFAFLSPVKHAVLGLASDISERLFGYWLLYFADSC